MHGTKFSRTVVGLVVVAGFVLVPVRSATWGATFTVTTTADGGAGSLRQAILDANTNAGPDTIEFNIGVGPATIAPTSALPIITDPVTIDGATQPGFVDAPIIELSGENVADGQGIHVTAGDSTIRGLVVNRFTGFDANGIRFDTGGNNVLEGCYVGTDLAGTNALGNLRAGVDIVNSPSNRIGGATASARNLISANNTGISIFGNSARFNVVQGNFIGTDVTGTARLGNLQSGIYVGNAFNTIGGSGTGEGNLFSGNGTRGVRIVGVGASNNVVQGNLIGTDVTGAFDLGNHANGVLIEEGGSNNTIGGVNDGEGNRIAYNTTNGVYVVTGTGNAILGNSIYFNTALGIDIGQRLVTTNDLGDADAGANRLQNFPVLTNAVTSGGVTTVQGALNSVANSTLFLEFFSNSECDPSGFGEGETLVGSTNLTTDAGGDAGFSVTLPVVISAGLFITSTATDEDGNTSEFSQCAAVREEGFSILCALAPSFATNLVGTSHTVTATVLSNGLPANGVTVNFFVASGPNVGENGSDVTDANGEATFNYTSNGDPGTDVIQSTGTVSAVSFSCVANKLWDEPANQPPTALCQDVVRVADSNLQANATAADVDFGSFDADGDPITLSLDPVGPYNLGTNTVTLTVADDQGGTNTCSAQVIVQPNPGPTALCQDVVRLADTNLMAVVTAAEVDNGSFDPDGGPVTLSLDPVGPYLAGTNDVNLVVIDDEGLTNTCAAQIIVQTTLDIGVAKGKITDSTSAAKDKAKIKGTLAFNANSPDGTFDPLTESAQIRLGDLDNPLIIHIPAGDPGWKVKGAKSSWKSASGALPKVKLSLDTAKGTLKLSVSGFDFPGAQENPLQVTLILGNDSGVFLADWSEKKPGSFKFP